MKKLLVTLSLLPTLTYAQEFRFSLHGGINPRTTRSYVSEPNLSLAAKTILSFNRIEAGISFETGWYQSKASVIHVHKSQNQPKPELSVYTGASYYCLYLLGNYKFLPHPDVELYSGLAAGIDIAEAVRRDVVIVHKESQPYLFPNNYYRTTIYDHGIALGLQVGARYKLGSVVSLNGEIAVRTSIIGQGTLQYMPWYFPCTAGISFRLFGRNTSKNGAQEDSAN